MAAYTQAGVYSILPSPSASFGGGAADGPTPAQLEGSRSNLRQTLLFAPVTTVAVYLAGLLGSVLSFLWLLALGRRAMSLPAVTTEAVWLALVQVIATPYIGFAGSGLVSGVFFGQTPLFWDFASGTGTLALFLAAVIGLGYLAQRSHGLRLVLPSLLPLAILTLAAVLRSLLAFAGWTGMRLFVAGMFANTLNAWYTVFFVTNPLAQPVGYFAMTDRWLYHQGQVYFQAQALLIPPLQLLLLPILARFALNAVRRYRQAAE